MLTLKEVLQERVQASAASRWEILPASEQEQIHLASTTTTTTAATTVGSQVAAIRRNIGGFLRQEPSNNDQILCFYRNIQNDNEPISYLCDLGCCSHGCCSAAEIAEGGTRVFGWALALLILFIIACVFAVLAVVSIYILNRHRDKQHAAELAASSSTHSGSASQISGPTTYYGHESYYNPYTTTSGLKSF